MSSETHVHSGTYDHLTTSSVLAPAVGSVAGAFTLVVAVVLAVFFYRKRKRRQVPGIPDDVSVYYLSAENQVDGKVDGDSFSHVAVANPHWQSSAAGQRNPTESTSSQLTFSSLAYLSPTPLVLPTDSVTGDTQATTLRQGP
jgi:hypothetical protein